MTTDPEMPRPMNDLDETVITSLGKIENRLESIQVQLRRIEKEILVAENRTFRQVGSFAGLTDAQRAAEQEWQRVEAAGRAAVDHQ